VLGILLRVFGIPRLFAYASQSADSVKRGPAELVQADLVPNDQIRAAESRVGYNGGITFRV